ncbi:MAG: hypothetical protein IPL46_12750 [Saprospiraceae bacterium]|nr:hypothetical protein [Saprospiraceae bacterium]
MKILFTVLVLSLFFNSTWSQDVDTSNFETFNYESEGKVYVMQQYFLVFLKKGTSKSENKEEASKIQEQHLAYLGDLYKKGIICMNGPFGDDGDIRGATVYRVASAEEALRLASGDPAVEAGRLSIEVHPWWLARDTGVR